MAHGQRMKRLDFLVVIGLDSDARVFWRNLTVVIFTVVKAAHGLGEHAG